MCRSKMDINAAEPSTTTPRTPRRPSRTAKSSFTNSSSTDPTSVNHTAGSSNKYTSTTSASSRTSLSSFRDALPENPHLYDFTEICSATNNFLAKRFSSSAAWRCTIRGKDVIVFQHKFRRPVEPWQLRQRLATICRGHHVSIIKLRGASISGEHIYLVYDFVNGANLAECLRNPKTPNYTVLSTWLSRMQIATDVAQGLDYIHNYTGLNTNFIHNHIKSSSVIVTEPSFHAKICHFGTAELCGEVPDEEGGQEEEEEEEQSGEITEEKQRSSKIKRTTDNRVIKFEGARGYMSPEFQSTGIATQKSDVFAFGVLLLELLSGEEPLKFKFDKEKGDYRRISVIETAREAVKVETESRSGDGDGDGGKIRRWIDRRLKDSYPMDVAEKMTRMAVECVHVEPDKRPDMRRVAGKISRLYLESQKWSEKLRVPTDFSVSWGPR